MPVHPSKKLEEKISAMDRRTLISLLRKLNCGFELDLTDEFLNSLSLRRLRHIVVAVSLHASNAAELEKIQNGN